MARVRVTHLFSSFRNLGGVEGVLRHHYQHDAAWHLHSHFAIYFEPAEPAIPRVFFLDYKPRTSIRQARRRLAEVFRETQPDIVVYHGPWGMPYLAGLDQGARRVLVLHGETPETIESLRTRGSWVDGILCVSEPLKRIIHRTLPDLSEDRVELLPYPIAPPDGLPPRVFLPGGPLRLGFCGRLIVEQKRVDRLDALCRALDDARLSYCLEFLGDGPERMCLEQRFPDRTRFVFHGRLEGQAFWRTLSQWDAIVFTSDYEGTPIALLEALSCGVIPLYPRIGSGGDSYAECVDTQCLYTADEFAQPAAFLAHLSQLPAAQMEELRQRCRLAASPHIGQGYMRTFSAFLQHIRELPRRARDTFPKRPFPFDYLSFTALQKLSAFRRTLLRPQGGRVS